jgi:CelD/BcsL family acetyltransferase involved in cellulose biosynthesis
MAVTPLIEEIASGRGDGLGHGLAAIAAPSLAPDPIPAIEAASTLRRLAVYPASAGYDLVAELSHLANRSIEPNVFFNPRFLAPAMPRLEDREVRLAVIRDGDTKRSRLRLLVPFTLERPAPVLGVPVLRAWSSPYSPLGTPLVDRDSPADYVEDLLTMLGRPHLGLPKVFVFPDILLDGAFAGTLRLLAQDASLPMVTIGQEDRVFLESTSDGDAYLEARLSAHHRGEFRRQRRKLEAVGPVDHGIARTPAEIRIAAENFLALENGGWKGSAGTAMAADRYRAAFFREAMDRMASADMVRIHTLSAGGKPVASLVVLIEAGVAHAWKTAFDETHAALSPGMLLMVDATCSLLDDPNVIATDSCAGTGHAMISRLWGERRRLGTIVVGLNPAVERQTRQAAKQLQLGTEARFMAKRLRDKVKRMLPGR